MSAAWRARASTKTESAERRELTSVDYTTHLSTTINSDNVWKRIDKGMSAADKKTDAERIQTGNTKRMFFKRLDREICGIEKTKQEAETVAKKHDGSSRGNPKHTRANNLRAARHRDKQRREIEGRGS